MPWEKESWHARFRSRIADFFTRWWREATGPSDWRNTGKPVRAMLRRAMLWVPVIVLLTVVVAGAGLYFFTGWRAGDLARKAMDNAIAGNLAMAQLQIMSANNLRPDSSAVKRALVYVQSRFDDPASLAKRMPLEEAGRRMRLLTMRKDVTTTTPQIIMQPMYRTC